MQAHGCSCVQCRAGVVLGDTVLRSHRHQHSGFVTANRPIHECYTHARRNLAAIGCHVAGAASCMIITTPMSNTHLGSISDATREQRLPPGLRPVALQVLESTPLPAEDLVRQLQAAEGLWTGFITKWRLPPVLPTVVCPGQAARFRVSTHWPP